MRTSSVERRLVQNSKRIKKVKADLSVVVQQHSHMAGVADDEQVRSIVADAPGHGNRAERHAEKLATQRSKLIAELARLELLQDELLDQLG